MNSQFCQRHLRRSKVLSSKRPGHPIPDCRLRCPASSFSGSFHCLGTVNRDVDFLVAGYTVLSFLTFSLFLFPISCPSFQEHPPRSCSSPLEFFFHAPNAFGSPPTLLQFFCPNHIHMRILHAPQFLQYLAVRLSVTRLEDKPSAFRLPASSCARFTSSSL